LSIYIQFLFEIYLRKINFITTFSSYSKQAAVILCVQRIGILSTFLMLLLVITITFSFKYIAIPIIVSE